MSGGEPVVRTSEWVQREYGREKWPAIERMVDEELATEAELGRVLGRVTRREASPEGALALSDMTVAGSRVVAPRAVAKGSHQALVIDAVADACSEDTKLVVELGSGWGRNILSLWLTGGPRAATYIGAEYTEAGRRVASRLAELDQQLDFRSLAWDYHHPDLSELSPVEEAVIFSAHSIEQIPQLPGEAVDAVLGLARRVTCLHFEPVGWQVEDHEGAGSSADYAARHDYNRNLVSLLREKERQGQLRIETIMSDVIGENPDNATTVIAWHALPRLG